MSEARGEGGKSDAGEVLALLTELSQQLLAWSWEGVAGYEEAVEQVGRTYGYADTTVLMEAQSAMIKLEPEGRGTFVKVGIPGFPPMAHTQDLKNMLADIYAGKLSLSEARGVLKSIHEKKPPYSPLLVWLGVVVISLAFAVDLVGTWEGVLWAGITAIPTGLVFLAADRVPGFNKIAPLVGTAVSGIIVMVAFKFGWTAAFPGLLLIASNFVFIPGDSISTQAYELAVGRWSAGVDRLFYAIIMLVLLVVGAALAAMLTGTPIADLFPKGPHEAFAWWSVYPGRMVLVLGILLAFQMSAKHFLPAVLTLWIATVVAQVASLAYGELAGTFFAVVVGTVLALWQARKPRSIPAFVLMIPIIFAVSPGSHGLRQLEVWVSGDVITGVNDLQTLAGTLFAIAIGMMVGRVLVGRRWDWIPKSVKG
jgi:uncharacterized membrane protein YjjP (DUF1212 family)/uncharacterized membrane protein YjjB (DUF3815 family)